MLVQLIYSLLSRISIPFLKDDDGPFAPIVHFGELSVAVPTPYMDDISAQLIPVQFKSSDAHSYLRSAGRVPAVWLIL